jgi:hypothetical protein
MKLVARTLSPVFGVLSLIFFPIVLTAHADAYTLQFSFDNFSPGQSMGIPTRSRQSLATTQVCALPSAPTALPGGRVESKPEQIIFSCMGWQYRSIYCFSL